MQSIKTLFWNGDQRRLRTLWRLICQLIILVILLIVVEGAVGFLVVGLFLAREGVSSGQLADPQALQQFIIENPLAMMLSNIGLVLSLTISIWLGARFLDRRPFADLGLHIDRDWWIDFGFGLALGAGLMLIIFLVEIAAGWVTVTGTFVTKNPDANFLTAILVPVVAFVAVGFYEELFSRGYQLQNLAEGLNWGAIGPRGAILIATLLSSMVFGSLHIANPNASIVSTLFLIVAGFLLAAGILLTGELAIPIGLHIAWNFFQGNVFGFPVSGTDVRSATFISVEQGGPGLWTGGAFGPEAGLLGLGAIIVGILLTALWVHIRYGQLGLDLSLAQAPALSKVEGSAPSEVEDPGQET
jgi:membrane protease YdiL (CAAX protease family)